MSPIEMDKMTWEDIDKVNRSITLVFLPISPVEEHGPHLTLGTDFYGALDLTRWLLRY
jgi:creatinine amidohydrolase